MSVYLCDIFYQQSAGNFKDAGGWLWRCIHEMLFDMLVSVIWTTLPEDVLEQRNN